MICIEQTSAMFFPLILNDRASLLSRVPSHSGQVVNVTARSTNIDVLGQHRLLDLRDQPLDDRRRQAIQDVHLRPRQCGMKPCTKAL